MVSDLVQRSLAWVMRKPEWEYGIAGPGMVRARRNTRRGNVQFLLWRAGQQGHAADYWHDMDSSWWPTFQPDAKARQALTGEAGGAPI